MTLAQGRAPKEPAEGKASRLDDAVGPQTEAVVDLDAIAHNVRVLREFAGDAALMAVIKADGYNHGAVAVARTALSAGARELGVTTIAEALVLREAGITAPVLAWRRTCDDKSSALKTLHRRPTLTPSRDSIDGKLAANRRPISCNDLPEHSLTTAVLIERHPDNRDIPVGQCRDRGEPLMIKSG